jgi:hypothetical protein
MDAIFIENWIFFILLGALTIGTDFEWLSLGSLYFT